MIFTAASLSWLTMTWFYVINSFREYNKKRGLNRELSFICQSNGSLLTVDKVKQLRELGCQVGISLDGPRHVHNENRVFNDGSGTFERHS